jgi:hypothetical protein
MNIFTFLSEEANLIEPKLNELVHNIANLSREKVFADVKLICDELRGYWQKQGILLLDKLEADSSCAPQLKVVLECRDQLKAELETLVMVHVDEPGYKKYLESLLGKAQAYFGASANLYDKLNQVLSKSSVERLNEECATLIHSDVGYNNLQEAS